jgi:carbonic anhydrase
VSTARLTEPLAQATGCEHIEPILRDIQKAIDPAAARRFPELSKPEQNALVDNVARANVLRTVAMIREQSQTLSALVAKEQILIVGAIYDVSSGAIDILSETAPAAG